MIENIPALWFIAFFIDVVLGCLSFYLVFGRIVRKRYEGLAWYMGWWAFVDAIALVINAVMGVHYFWSYHQVGIITDTAINLGLIIYVARVIRDNWALNDEDWDKINRIRKDAKIRELSK